jgi:murein DD-endopeptidase MepM/ murein hydrolase activator NlpD
VGQTVFSTDWLNMRRSPGHVGKLGDDLLGMLAPATAAVIQAGPQQKDGLVWWLVQAVISGGQPTSGWVAEATSALRLLTAAKPRTATRRAGPQTRGRGVARATARGVRDVTVLFAAAYVNLRRAPGTVGKPADDVIGQIPYGAKVERLGGPVSADGLAWWSVRAPLLDNSVASGWAAETQPGGMPLLVETPPAAPATDAGAVYGSPFQPDEALTLLATAPLRPSASTTASTPAPLLPNSSLRVLGGPDLREGLEWWQLAPTSPAGAADTGWAPLTNAEGTRVLAATAVAQAIRVARPFAGVWSLTQGWGLWPDYYQQFLYDGVPLKGHNGIDFGTPENTPLLAVDDGEVLRVDFEPGGFGHFVLLRHHWGESLYAHLNRVDVAQGAPLALGQSLGVSGNSGGTFGPHLHFGVRVYPYRRTDGWGGFVNPLPFMQLADLPISRGAEARPQPMAPELPGRLRP